APLAQPPRASHRPVQELCPFAYELSARSVDARQEQRRGACRFLQLEAELEALDIDPVGSDRQNRGLGKTRERFVDRADSEIGSLGQRSLRYVRMLTELAIQAPGVVGDQRKLTLVTDIGEGLY